jgi:hypothetical protein
MRFTTSPHQWVWDDPLPVPLNYAQVYYPQILADTVGWTLVSGSFVADSAYQYVMIGNHFDNSQTDTLPFEPTISLPMAYTFIDDVCVSRSLSGCPLMVGLEGHVSSDMVLFPNPASTTVLLTNVAEGAQVTVADVSGRIVWLGSVAVGELQLNVEAWARGIYILKLESQGRSRSFKFVLVD